MKSALRLAIATLSLAGIACSQQSPASTATVTIGGKTLTIKYGAPSVRGRKIFGDGGRVSKDGTYPVWRLGADSATAFHTDANLDIQGLKVPAGDYTLYAQVDSQPWQLIVSKQTGQWGTVYKKENDLGRVKMTMSKPDGLVETMKITLSAVGTKAGKLLVEWENSSASVNFKVE
jgi:hypothetical protein